jgi:hypothetical protein
MNRKLTQNELEPALGSVPPVLTPQEAADLLRIKVSTLYLDSQKSRGRQTRSRASR